METTLKVASSTQTENGNFCNKLVAETSVKSAFGNVSSRQTYYMFTDQENKVGTEGKLDLSAFDIVDKDFVTEDGDVISLKYVYPKR